MYQHIVQRHPMLRFTDQYPRNEVLSLCTHPLFEDLIRLQVKVSDIRVCVSLIRASEGSLPSQQFICEYTHCPYVYFVIVGLLIDKFWGHVVDRTTKSHASLVYGMGGPTEITKLYMHLLQVHNKDVLRFDISVYNISLLHIQECTNQLFDYVTRFVL